MMQRTDSKQALHLPSGFYMELEGSPVKNDEHHPERREGCVPSHRRKETDIKERGRNSVLQSWETRRRKHPKGTLTILRGVSPFRFFLIMARRGITFLCSSFTRSPFPLKIYTRFPGALPCLHLRPFSAHLWPHPGPCNNRRKRRLQETAQPFDLPETAPAPLRWVPSTSSSSFKKCH